MIVIAPCPGQADAAPRQQCSCKMREIGQGKADRFGADTLKIDETIDGHRRVTLTNPMRTQIDGNCVLKQEHGREGGAQGPAAITRCRCIDQRPIGRIEAFQLHKGATSVSIIQRRFDIAVTGNIGVDGAALTRPSIMVIIGAGMNAHK